MKSVARGLWEERKEYFELEEFVGVQAAEQGTRYSECFVLHAESQSGVRRKHLVRVDSQVNLLPVRRGIGTMPKS